MTSNQKNDPATPPSAPARPSSEEMIRRLEQFPIEVLEAVLLVLQIREARAKS